MPSPRVRLRTVDATPDGAVWEGAPPVRVGRLPGHEVSLKDSSVSRHHSEVALTARGWFAHDLGSRNGTFVNGTRVGPAGHALRVGDILQFGRVCFVVEVLEGGEERPSGIGVCELVDSVCLTWEGALRMAAPGQGLASGAAGRLLVLLGAARDFARFTSLDAYLRAVLWEAVGATDCRRGAVLMRDEPSAPLTAAAVFAMGESAPRGGWWDVRVAERALARGESLLCTARHGGKEGGPRPAVYALLRAARGPFGVLFLDRDPDQAPLGRDQLYLGDAAALGVSATIDGLAEVLRRQREMVLHTLTALSQLVELRNESAGGRADRVTQYALLLGEELSLSEPDAELLRAAVAVHDLGTIGVSDRLLAKLGPLTPAERVEMESHVLKGTGVLELVPSLAPLLPIVRSHHERWDGKGYPDGLAGERIPLLARVLAVAEAFDAMTSDRPYRDALSEEEAFAEVEREAGKQFDPECAQAWLRLRPRVEDMLRQWQGTVDTLR